MISFFLLSRLLIRRRRASLSGELPVVSILVAARNEEENIRRCLEALHALDYPHDRLEILIGDDHSEDATAAIVQEYIADKPQFRLFSGAGAAQGEGKAAVLEKLAEAATGAFLFITDADIAVTPGWVRAMLPWFDKEVGVVTGFTTIQGNRPFHHLQAIDWCYALGAVALLSEYKLPVSAMGNNMAVRSEAYWDVGGYANIPFSLTEDYALFRAVTGKGWGFVNRADATVKALSQPTRTFGGLMQQRKRWMHGIVQLPWFARVIPVVQLLFYMAVAGLLFLNPLVGATVWGTKIVLQSLFTLLVLKNVQEMRLAKWVLWYDFYALIVSISVAVFYLLPVKVTWKGRTYS